MKNVMELFKGDAVKFFGIDKQIISGTTVSAEARTELTHIHIQRNIDDWILEAEDNTFIHFEFQSSDNPKDLSRFMISDALLYHSIQRPIRTIIVYTADIKNTITALDAGAIKYSVDAFYMSTIDGDATYEAIRAKVAAGKLLNKQDLMSIVFLPMMNTSGDKVASFEKSISLSQEVPPGNEQVQIQAMLQLLADKFIKDQDILQKLKEMMRMSVISKMIWQEAIEEGLKEGHNKGMKEGMREGMKEGMKEKSIAIAKKMLQRGTPVDIVKEDTELDEAIIIKLLEDLNPVA